MGDNNNLGEFNIIKEKVIKRFWESKSEWPSGNKIIKPIPYTPIPNTYNLVFNRACHCTVVPYV